jgi:hypothetical protein
VVVAGALGAELGLGIPRDVDLPPELPLDSSQGGQEFGHFRRSNNQKIDITPGLLFPAGHGTVDGRPVDAASEGREF